MISEDIQQQIVRLNQQVVQLYQKGEYEQAMEIAIQANELTRQHHGMDHPDFATSLDNLAMIYKSMGRYIKAEPLYLKAIEIIRKAAGENNDYFAGCLNNLASLYKAMGNYVAAEPLYHQVKEIWSGIHGENNPEFAIFLNNLADLYYLLGRYSEAEHLYHQVLETLRATVGEISPQFARSLNNLAEVHMAMGNYSKAEPDYLRSFEILRMIFGEKHPEVAVGLNNLAGLYKVMGDYDKVEQSYQQAGEIWRTAFGEEYPNYLTTIANLADLYYWKGNFSHSETLQKQALEIRRKTLGENHPDVALSLNGMAVLYKNNGKYIEAESYYRQALDIWLKCQSEKDLNVALVLHNLAALYHAKGNYTQAETYYCQALEIRRKYLGEEHPDIAVCLNSLAVLYVKMSRLNEALALMEQAAMNDDRLVGQIFSIGSESQRMAYLKTLYGNFDAFLSLILLVSNQSSAVLSGFDLVLRRKAIGAEALAAQRDAVLGGKYHDLAPKLQELANLRMQIAKKTLAVPEADGIETHKLLTIWRTQKEQLEAELAHKVSEMNLEQKLRDADRRAVARGLPAGSVLIEFIRFHVFDFKALPAGNELLWKPACYLVFVLSAGEPDNVKMIDLGEAESIEHMIVEFRSSIKDGGRNLIPVETLQKTSMDDGRALRAAVFDPLLWALSGCKRLFLAPDGDLTRLPFEVLPMDHGGRLIDEYQISYLGTGRDVLRFGVTSAIEPNASLVAADPDFDLGSGNASSRSMIYFGRLPGTRMEGEQIAAMLGVQPLLNGTVLKTKLKVHRSPHILHIATHGFFLEDQKYGPDTGNPGWMNGQEDSIMGRLAHVENPLMRCGLALANANSWFQEKPLPVEAEDGILTAEDVSGLDLLSTELVVLSACETGLGKVQIGEGVFGLRRAFVLAGARTLVMSLWKVPDQQTQELMVDFYRRILDGQPRVDALHDVQLAIKKEYPDPYYWGAFICLGDPGSFY